VVLVRLEKLLIYLSTGLSTAGEELHPCHLLPASGKREANTYKGKANKHVG
jgi:hypothetical protein